MLTGVAARWGNLAEIAIRAEYGKAGWWVVPVSAIENGGAPKLIGLLQSYVLPDCLKSRNGFSRWAEIKYKDHCQKYQKQTIFEHGIDLPNWRAYLEVEDKTGIPGDLSILQYRPGVEADPSPVHLWQSFAELRKHVMIVDRPHATFNRGAAYWNVYAFKCSPVRFVPPPDLLSISKQINPWDRKSKTGVAPKMDIQFCEDSPFERYGCRRCGKAGTFGYRNKQGEMEWFCLEHRLAKHWADGRREAA